MLKLFFSLESDKENVLYIAMAGTHQIWVYFLQDSDWLKGRFVMF